MELPERNNLQFRNKSVTDKKTQKRIAHVKSAGQWARMLGWAVLIFLPLTGIFTSTPKDLGPLIVYALALPMAIILLCSGKYIQYLGGTHIRKLLVLNAGISILGVWGIIPIFTFVTSIVGIVAYSKLRKSGIQLPYSRSTTGLTRNEIIATVIVVVLGCSILGYCYTKGGINTDQSTISSSNSSSFKKYTSVEHGFTINFPGNPTSERETLDANGYKVPYTIYSNDDDSGNTAYLIGVYDYTSFDLDETAALEGAVDGVIQNTKGASLVSSKFLIYLDLQSIEAHYKLPVKGKPYDGYMRGFIRGDKMYVIYTIGENQTAFYRYADSFGFTQ